MSMDQWKQEKLLKKAKKKARKDLEKKGLSKSEASSAVKQSLRRMVMSNKPQKRAAGRGR